MSDNPFEDLRIFFGDLTNQLEAKTFAATKALENITITVDQAAEILHCEVAEVIRYMDERKLKYVQTTQSKKRPKNNRITRPEWVQDFLETLAREAGFDPYESELETALDVNTQAKELLNKTKITNFPKTK